jgi:hypothetical protein
MIDPLALTPLAMPYVFAPRLGSSCMPRRRSPFEWLRCAGRCNRKADHDGSIEGHTVRDTDMVAARYVA